MGRYKINADAWRQATLVLLRYQESKTGIEECVRDAMARDPETRSRGSKQAHPDPTAAAADRLLKNPKYARLKREIKAVEDTMAGLNDIEREIIKKRFWMHRKGHRKPCPYQYMTDLGYERASMQRTVRKAVAKVARELGEI